MERPPKSACRSASHTTNELLAGAQHLRCSRARSLLHRARRDQVTSATRAIAIGPIQTVAGHGRGRRRCRAAAEDPRARPVHGVRIVKPISAVVASLAGHRSQDGTRVSRRGPFGSTETVGTTPRCRCRARGLARSAEGVGVSDRIDTGARRAGAIAPRGSASTPRSRLRPSPGPMADIARPGARASRRQRHHGKGGSRQTVSPWLHALG